MKVYLLWFSEYEASHVLGTFETKEQAERWRDYFIKNPVDTDYMDMTHYSKKEDFKDRFGIEERELGKLDPNIKIDTLAYVEWCYNKNKEFE